VDIQTGSFRALAASGHGGDELRSNAGTTCGKCTRPATKRVMGLYYGGGARPLASSQVDPVGSAKQITGAGKGGTIKWPTRDMSTRSMRCSRSGTA
jgi:hypothetical protein